MPFFILLIFIIHTHTTKQRKERNGKGVAGSWKNCYICNRRNSKKVKKMSTEPHELHKKKDDFLKALELSLGNITIACKNANVGRRTYYEWIEKDPDFVEAVNYVEDLALDFVESKMFERIRGYEHKETKYFSYQGQIKTRTTTRHYPPDSGLISFYLETKGQKRGYVKKQIIDFNKVDPFEGKTEEEIDAILEQMDEDEKKELELREKLKK